MNNTAKTVVGVIELIGGYAGYKAARNFARTYGVTGLPSVIFSVGCSEIVMKALDDQAKTWIYAFEKIKEKENQKEDEYSEIFDES